MKSKEKKNKLYASIVASIIFSANCSIFGESKRLDIWDIGANEMRDIGYGAANQGTRFAYYDIHDGGTLKWDKSKDSRGSAIWNQIVATNGLAVIDVSEHPSSKPVFAAGFYTAGGKGTVRIVGKSEIIVGHEDASPHLLYFSGANDMPNIEFYNTDGTPAEGKVYYRTACISSFPDCTWSFEKPSSESQHYVALMGNEQMFAGDGVEVPSGTTFAVSSAGAIASDQTVTVKENSHVTFFPGQLQCMLEAEEDPSPEQYYGKPFRLSPLDASESLAYSFNVNLETKSSTVAFRKNSLYDSAVPLAGVKFSGDISGAGSVTVEGGCNVALSGNINVPVAVGAGATLDLDGATVSEVACNGDNVSLKACGGTDAKLVPHSSSAEYALRLDRESSITVDDSDFWRKEVSYWFDFSDKSTLRHVGQDSDWEGTENPPENNGFLLIERALDCRGYDGVSLWNRRLYPENAGGNYTLVGSVYPFLEENASGQGMSVLRFGLKDGSAARRLPFCAADGTAINVKAALVVMAFYAKDGGGWALLGTESGAFARTSTDLSAGITTTDNHAVWVDGVRLKDPTAENVLSDQRFQIISIETIGENLNGIGWIKAWNDTTTHGGQRYGEILIFEEMPSERVRCEAESYLAKKWKVADYYSTQILNDERAKVKNTLTATGSGTISLKGNTGYELGGNFGGTVELNGGTLTIKDAFIPYDDATLPTDDCVGWFDPDTRDTVKLVSDFDSQSEYGSDQKDGVRLIYDRSKPAHSAGDPVAVGVGNRMPRLVSKSCESGVERNWLDFEEVSDGAGNCLRIGPYKPDNDYGATQPTDILQRSIATGFIVLDSSRKHFTPIQSVVGGDSGDIFTRLENTTSIWRDSSNDKIKNGETRLNGVVVDQSKGFSGKPEVLAFRPTDNIEAAVFGSYRVGQGSYAASGRDLLMGEVLLYSSKLSDEDTARVEGYLMKKWFGILPTTCSDVRGATVTGSGTVQAAYSKQLPKFAEDFAGTVKVDSGNIEVTIDPETGTLTGAVIAPGAMLELPDDCTLSVSFASRPDVGKNGKMSWTVLNCKEISGGVRWSYAFDGDVSSDGMTVKMSSTSEGCEIKVETRVGLKIIVL